MPSGAHGVPGAHDRSMVRQAVELSFAGITLEDDRLSAVVKVANVGAGHYFPTTATPRAVLQIQLLGADGPIEGSKKTWSIGRTVTHGTTGWVEMNDTRIAPKKAETWTYSGARAGAETVEAALFFYPDWIYIGFYQQLLAKESTPLKARRALTAALEAAESSVITVAVRRHPL